MFTKKTHRRSSPEQQPSSPRLARNVHDAAEGQSYAAARYGRRYVHVYLGLNAKAVEVELDGQWYDGILRSWDQADDRSWSGAVTWRRAPGETLSDRFPAERIREHALTTTPNDGR